jgi:hypothetical protein
MCAVAVDLVHVPKLNRIAGTYLYASSKNLAKKFFIAQMASA